MMESLTTLPSLLQEYFTTSGFWAGPADYDFWYAATLEEWFWLHVRRKQGITLAVSFFSAEADGVVDLDLYNLSRAPVYGLRATIVNTPLMTLSRAEPGLPLVALRLRNGTSQRFTLPRAAQSLADQWLAESLGRLLGSLTETWQLSHTTWLAERAALHALWPVWAGRAPDE